MSQVDGLTLLRAALAANPDTIVIVMTGNPSVESSIEALRQGAWDYLPKPFTAQHLQIAIGRAVHTVLVGQETREQEAVLERQPAAGDRVTLLGTSTAFRAVIQDGVVRRVGSETTDAVVNVRFIAATNGDAEAAVQSGALREDLYYRLRVVPIQVPPLRDRPEDIPLLAEYFLSTYWVRHRKKGESFPKLSDGAVRALCTHPWRGNVRELQNVIEHVAVLDRTTLYRLMERHGLQRSPNAAWVVEREPVEAEQQAV